MFKLILISISLLCSLTATAMTNYQVDLILFRHHNAHNEQPFNNPPIPASNHNQSLVSEPTKTNKPYHLLAPAKSSLRDEYYQLTHKAQYQVLGHYSWIQPKSNQNGINLPIINQQGWQLRGHLRIRESNYYLFDANLQLSPPDAPQSAFLITQKQRLKGETVYYLDHSQLGIVVKIHRV